MSQVGRSLGVFCLAGAMFASLIGCNGSSGTNAGSAATTLTGTAATGAALSATITAVDSKGIRRSVHTNADGSYSINTQGMTPSFLIQAVPDGNGPTLYSFSDTAGGITVNITPLTNLALYLAHGKQDLAQLFLNWITLGKNITEAGITNQQKVINQNLFTHFQGQGVDPTTFDFFNDPFKANQTGFDAVLDGLDVGLTPGGGFTFRARGGAFIPFDEKVDTSKIRLNPGAPGTPGGAPPIAANEVAATIPPAHFGTFTATFRVPNFAAAGGPHNDGDSVTFTIGDGTLAFNGKTLIGPVLRNGNPHEAIWKDLATSSEYAYSSLVTTPNEINVGGPNGASFFGQFPHPQKAP